MFGLYLSIDHAQWGWKKKKKKLFPSSTTPINKKLGAV